MSSNDQTQLIINGKHKMTNFIKEETSNTHNKEANIFIIKQTLEDQQIQQSENIKRCKVSICDLQSQLYYSIYLIKDYNSSNQNVQIQYSNISDYRKNIFTNIKLSNITNIDEKFIKKLQLFLVYKRDQMLKMTQDTAKKNWFRWFDQMMSPENKDFRYQIFSLYTAIKNVLNQGYQSIFQLYQNFHPQYNLLMHASSITQSIFCQDYEQNKVTDFPKFIYINLTGKESKDNLQFWRELNYYYQRHCLYFSIYWIQNQMSSEQIKRELYPSNIQTVIPYCSKDNVSISKFEMKIIFNQFIKTKLIQFKPIIIYVDIWNTQYFQIQDDALQRLVGKLRKYAKVVIHIKYDMETQPVEQASLSFLRTLNACLFGIQRIKIIAKKESYGVFDSNYNETFKNFFENKLFGVQKSIHLINFFKAQQLFMNQKQQSGNNLEKLYFVIMQENKENLIIKPQNYKKKRIYFQQIYISYKYNVILLLDFQNQMFYYYSKQDFSKLDNECIFNEFKGKIPLGFNGKIKNAQVIIHDRKILFFFPIIIQDEKLIQLDIILVYCLNQDRWDQFSRKQILESQDYDKYFDNENTEKYISQLKKYVIIGQTVSHIQHLQANDFQVFALFGGEIIESFQPMNLIQYLFVNFENKQFNSKFIRRHNNPFLGSIKPSPYLLVLPININSQLFQNNQIIAAYLILRPWNQTKSNYYESMLNLQNLNKAQVLFQYLNNKGSQISKRNKNDFKTIILDIDSQISTNTKYLINILEVMNSNVNWMGINENDQQCKDEKMQWEWRAIYTRYFKIKNLKYLLNSKVSKQQDQKQINQFNQITKNIINEKNQISLIGDQGTKLISFEYIIRLTYSNNQQQHIQLNNNSQYQQIQQNQINKKFESQNLLNQINQRQVSQNLSQNINQIYDSNKIGEISSNQLPFLSFSQENWSLQSEIVWDYNIKE